MTILHRIRRDEGLTLIEVMVAVLLLSGGLLATLSIFNSGQRASAGNTRVQSAYATAQSYLERLVDIRDQAQWNALKLSSRPVGEAPDTATNPSTPAAYLRVGNLLCGEGASCTHLAVVSNPNDSTSTPVSASPEELAVDTTNGRVVPKITLTNGDAIYQFVTMANDQTVTVNGMTFYGRRVLVAVDLAADSSKSVRKPVWVSTIVTDPTVTSP